MASSGTLIALWKATPRSCCTTLTAAAVQFCRVLNKLLILCIFWLKDLFVWYLSGRILVCLIYYSFVWYKTRLSGKRLGCSGVSRSHLHAASTGRQGGVLAFYCAHPGRVSGAPLWRLPLLRPSPRRRRRFLLRHAPRRQQV